MHISLGTLMQTGLDLLQRDDLLRGIAKSNNIFFNWYSASALYLTTTPCFFAFCFSKIDFLFAFPRYYFLLGVLLQKI